MNKYRVNNTRKTRSQNSSAASSIPCRRLGHSILFQNDVNPIKKRIWELARFELGRRKQFIRKVCRKEIIPNKRYAWLLYAAENASEPVDTVVLDVDPAEALAMKS